MCKIISFIFLFSVFACSTESEDKRFVPPIKLEFSDSTKRKVDTDTMLHVIDAVKKVKTTLVSGSVKFRHGGLGVPVMFGQDNGPSFLEVKKKYSSKSYMYKIEILNGGDIIKTIIAKYRNRFRYQFSLEQNIHYKINFYRKKVTDKSWGEITDGNYFPNTIYTRMTKNRDSLNLSVYNIVYTVI